MKNLKDILSEFALKSFPEWNQTQAEIFRQLKKEMDLNYDEFVEVAKHLRAHMNKNYFSGEWEVNKSMEDLFDELLNVSKEVVKRGK